MKMYVLVRRDLTKSQQAVQACHAVAEYLKSYETEWANGTMIVKKVESERDLCDWILEVDKHVDDIGIFVEPDIGDEITAAAFVGCSKIDEIVRKLPLL